MRGNIIYTPLGSKAYATSTGGKIPLSRRFGA